MKPRPAPRRILNRSGFLTALVTGVCFLSALETGKAQIISQYVETNSGSTPKGIEIWNQTVPHWTSLQHR